MMEQTSLFSLKENQGQRARVRQAKNTAEENRLRILDLRLKHYSNAAIAKKIGIDSSHIRRILEGHFGDKDPFLLRIKKEFDEGRTCKQIATGLDCHTSVVWKLLKKHGYDTTENYNRRVKEKRKEKIRAKRKHGLKIEQWKAERKRRATEVRAAKADDIYCFYLEHIKLTRVAEIAGFHPDYVSDLLMTIPAYAEQSKNRRAASIDKRKEIKGGRLSQLFKTEKEMALYAMELLKDYKPVMGWRDNSYMEIDIYIPDPPVIVELKRSARKVDIARGLGQVLINQSCFDEYVRGFICFPKDIDLKGGVYAAARKNGVTICYIDGLLTFLESMRLGVCSTV